VGLDLLLQHKKLLGLLFNPLLLVFALGSHFQLLVFLNQNLLQVFKSIFEGQELLRQLQGRELREFPLLALKI
jgi:hypothetical protein